MKTADRLPKRNQVARVQRLARERADAQARRVPWQRLLQARNEYIDSQEFNLWARSVLETENRIPDWLVEIVDERYPGFVEQQKRLTPKNAKHRPLPLRLEDWIDDHAFGFAKKEGWFSCITYYAVREPRYQRAEVCWSECVENWKKARPLRYPSFEEWKLMADRCDPTAHLVPALRRRMAGLRTIDPVRFEEAVSRYMDWEALGYWARPALERGRAFPKTVRDELRDRCPELLKSESAMSTWQELMTWISDHYFSDAQKEGWFGALVMRAGDHPRAIRTIEYAEHCEGAWGSRLPEPFPSFEEWRDNADSFVETSMGVSAGLSQASTGTRPRCNSSHV